MGTRELEAVIHLHHMGPAWTTRVTLSDLHKWEIDLER